MALAMMSSDSQGSSIGTVSSAASTNGCPTPVARSAPAADHSAHFGLSLQLEQQLAVWQQCVTQAKSACDAWQQKAENCRLLAASEQREKKEALKMKDKVLLSLESTKAELADLRGGPYLHCLLNTKADHLHALPPSKLKQLMTRLQQDYDCVEKCYRQQATLRCMQCGEKPRSVVLQPCDHFVFCEDCVKHTVDNSGRNDPTTCKTPRSSSGNAPNVVRVCPMCKSKIVNYSTIKHDYKASVDASKSTKGCTKSVSSKIESISIDKRLLLERKAH